MLAAAKGVAAPRSPDAEHAALPPPPCSSRAQQRRGRHGDGEAGFQSRRQVVSALAASELDSTARGAWRPWHVWRGSTGDEQQGWAARQLAKCARTLLAAATACSAAGGGGARRPQQQLADRGKQGQAGAPNGAADCGGAFALEPPYGGEAGIPEGAAQPNVHQLGAAWGCAGGGSRSGAAGDMASVRVLQGGNCKRAAGRMCSAAGPGGLWRCLVRCAVSRRAWWAGRCKPASGAKAGEGGEQRVRLTGLRLAAEQAGQQREGRPTYHRLTLRCQRWGPCAFLTAPWYSKEGLQGPRGRSRRVGAAARRGRRTATAVGAAWWCRVPVRWVLGLRNCPIRQPWRRAWDHRTPAMPPMPRSGEAGRAAEGHAVLASWPKALGWQVRQMRDGVRQAG